MSEQPSRKQPFWRRTLPAQQQSVTSRLAAEHGVQAAPNQRATVHEWITKHGPCTDEQIADGLNMNPSTVRPRRIELARAGLIVAQDKNGITKAGRHATRWVAA